MVGMTDPAPAARPPVYATTGPVPALAAIAIPPTARTIRPILRLQDRDLYFREDVDRMGIGTYGHVPLPVDAARCSRPSEAPVMPSVLRRSRRSTSPSHGSGRSAHPGPARARREVVEGINGIFSFTPDGFPLMGESPRRRGFWVAEAVWVTHSRGRRAAMAEWLVEGGRRSTATRATSTGSSRTSRAGVHRGRGSQNYIEVYDVIHPLQPMEDPRPLRMSPFHERESALGACFLEGSGWERPHWYQANEGLLERYGDDPGPGRMGRALLVADRRRRGAARRATASRSTT